MSLEAMELAPYSQEMANDQTIGYDLEPDNARPSVDVPDNFPDLEDEAPAPSSSILQLIDAETTRGTQKSKSSDSKFR